MKKCLVALSLVVATAAFANTLERVATVQVDNINGLTSAAGKLGGFMGNPMIGVALAGQLSSFSLIQKLGPMSTEPDKAAFLSVYLDPDKALDTSPEVTLLYPLAGTVKDFVAAHPGLKKTDGAYNLDGVGPVVGSTDGKWLAVGGSAAMAKLALKDLDRAMRPLAGDSLRLRLNQKGIAVLVKLLQDARKDLRKGLKADMGLPAAVVNRQAELSCRQFDRLIRIVEEFQALMIGLKVSDRGLDFGGRFKVREGGELCKIGRQTLAPAVFARIGRDALSADVWAKDSGHNVSMSQCAGLIRSLLGLLRTDLGIDCGRFFTVDERDDNLRMTVDFPALVTFLREFAEDKGRQKIRELERKFASPKFAETEVAKLQELMQGFDKPFTAECSAGSSEFVLKGFTPVAPVAARFAATLPEAAAKPVYEMNFISPYSVFKAMLPTLLKQLPAQERTVLDPIVANLPPEGKGGIAGATWREKGELRGVVRISADEIRSVAQAVTTGVSYWTLKAMQNAQMKGAGATKAGHAGRDDD